mgnify:CR=1 FL=1
MGFGGSVSAMLASLRHNKRERVSRFEKPNTYRSKNNISLKFKKLSEKELIKAKSEIKRKSQKNDAVHPNCIYHFSRFSLLAFSRFRQTTSLNCTA